VFPARAPKGHVLLTCLLGGTRAPDVLNLGDADLIALARSELQALTGQAQEPVWARVVKWPRAIPQYEVGHAARLERIREGLSRWSGLRLAGCAYEGPGLADCIRNSYALAEEMARERRP